jgi:hypothetical protein
LVPPVPSCPMPVRCADGSDGARFARRPVRCSIGRVLDWPGALPPQDEWHPFPPQYKGRIPYCGVLRLWFWPFPFPFPFPYPCSLSQMRLAMAL